MWSPAATLDDPSSANPRAIPTISTIYTVQISESNCNYDTTLEVSITLNPIPIVTAQKSNDIDCSIPTAQLTATGASAWLWSPADGLNFPERFNPIAAIDTTTVFVVTGTNSFGCYAKDSVQVKVTRENIPVNPVPNAFTPNNDGKNDCFGISK